MSFDILNEAFKRLNLLEDAFDTSPEGINNLSKFMDEDDVVDTVSIIDTEAETPEELSDSYVGKIIVNCNVCHSHIFKNQEELSISDDGIVNVDEACPYCGEKEGFVIVGKIEDFGEEDLKNTEENDTDSNDDAVEDDKEPEEVNEGKKSSIDRSKLKKLRESVDENPLKDLRSNIIEFPNGDYVYIEYKDGKIYAGDATNNGIIHKYEVDYDNALSVEQNIQNLYDKIVENEPKLVEELDIHSSSYEDYVNVIKRYCRQNRYTSSQALDMIFNVEQSSPWPQSPDLAIGIAEFVEQFIEESLKEVNEAADVTDQVVIKTSEAGFITKKKDLESQGYKVIGSGNGQIIMAKPKDIKEGLSYGELTAIESEWNKFKKSKGINGKAEADVAWEFIDTECKGVYDTEDERNEVFGVISTLEEKCEGDKCEEKSLNEAPYLEPVYDARQSFYNKAFVTDDDNDLYSYGLKVMTIKDGQPIITCPVDRISQTTLRHIKEFLLQNGFKAINKAQILRDYKQEVPTRDIKIDEAKNPRFVGQFRRKQTDNEVEAFVKVIREVADSNGFDTSAMSVDRSDNNSTDPGFFGFSDVIITLPVGGLDGKRRTRNQDTVWGINNIIFHCCGEDGYSDYDTHKDKLANRIGYGKDEFDAKQYRITATTDGKKKDYRQHFKNSYRFEGSNHYMYDDTIEEFRSDIDEYLKGIKRELMMESSPAQGANKVIEESIHDSQYRDIIYNHFEFSTDDKFLDLVADLVDRVEDFTNEQEIWEAVDSGMIYTDDQWTAYKHYCQMGDPADNMWEGLMSDMLSLCSKIADSNDVEEMDEALKESFKQKWTKRFNEGINNATVETDDSKLTMTADENGKVTVTTEPIENSNNVDGETITPIDDGTMDDIIDNSAENVEDAEEASEEVPEEDIDFEIEEVDEESIDELGESYMKRIYENVNSFKTTRIHTDESKMIVEGVITFKSGKTKSTGFVFEAHQASRDGKVKFLGENKHFSNKRDAFALNGIVSNKKLIAESLSYNYKMGKKDVIKGSVKRSK